MYVPWGWGWRGRWGWLEMNEKLCLVGWRQLESERQFFWKRQCANYRDGIGHAVAKGNGNGEGTSQKKNPNVLLPKLLPDTPRTCKLVLGMAADLSRQAAATRRYTAGRLRPLSRNVAVVEAPGRQPHSVMRKHHNCDGCFARPFLRTLDLGSAKGNVRILAVQSGREPRRS